MRKFIGQLAHYKVGAAWCEASLCTCQQGPQ